MTLSGITAIEFCSSDLSRAWLPAAWQCRPSRDAPQASCAQPREPRDLSPGQGSTASRTPLLVCKNAAFLRSSTQKRPQKPRAGKPSAECEIPKPLHRRTGIRAACRSLSVGKGAVARAPAKPGSNPNTKKATTSPSPAVRCFGGSRPDSQGFLADEPLPAAPLRAEQPFLCCKTHSASCGMWKVEQKLSG